jgi:hypothetical protein
MKLGSIFYGMKGRVLSGISYVVMLISAAQLGGFIALLPPKWSPWIFAVGATLTVFSERVQGGASKPEVRAAAQASDTANAKSN